MSKEDLGIRKQAESNDHKTYVPIKDRSLEDATDALNHIFREMSELMGFKDYYHRNYDGTSTLKKLAI